MNLGLKSLELKGEPTDERGELLTTLALLRSKGWRIVAVEEVAQAVESLGTEKVVRKDRKAAAEGMAQAKWVPVEVVARPLEILVGEKPRWQKSSVGKEGAGVASQWRLNHGKSKCGFPRNTGHQHEGERDDLEKNPSG